jgi:hypothetical protein
MSESKAVAVKSGKDTKLIEQVSQMNNLWSINKEESKKLVKSHTHWIYN